MLTTKLLSQGYQKTKLAATLKKFYGRHHDLSIPKMWQFPELFLMLLPVTRHKETFQIPDIRFYRYFLRSGLWAWCLPSNAYYPQTSDYTLCSGVHVCWSEHSDSSFIYGFMRVNYSFGTMTATTF